MPSGNIDEKPLVHTVSPGSILKCGGMSVSTAPSELSPSHVMGAVMPSLPVLVLIVTLGFIRVSP